MTEIDGSIGVPVDLLRSHVKVFSDRTDGLSACISVYCEGM